MQPETRRRTPWWALSSAAAAVIAVLAVGLGAQDVTPRVPGGGTVAESVQSIEATLVAAQRAAEAGDVVGARLLLEHARELVAGLPAEEQERFAEALGTAEQGVHSAEEAVRQGLPVPPWPGSAPARR